MTPYSYQRAETLADVITAGQRPGAHMLAGGTDLIAQMKSGHRAPRHIIDIKHVPELASVSPGPNGALAIGAAVSATRLAGDLRARESHAALHDAVQLIGSLQIQNRATLGGNICNAAPSADAVPALLADAATARIAGPGGERTLPLEQFFTGPGRTALQAGELLVTIELPAPAAGSASAYLRFTPRREMDIAIVGAAACITVDRGHTITAARVALASVAPTPIRALAAERALIGQPVSVATIGLAAAAAQSDATPISDTRASAEYRRSLVAVLVRRAIEQCASRLKLEVRA